ncbi:hypothetical protein PTTG_04628 [Puccinia triticina 1-1 BBBD Race 1]|uniref:cAMP-independent regulatory protein pac2 n=1 Tax=Puccinia triticina (isolate 1-1 / race 1 (BBBD)) TaxID=630390 RepID=A0A0C4EUZ6_PUCT1|nr:hypothetical protein PTTG_04628 [Puccinia triticina 1-1 BBBD Race 1]
MMSETWFGLVQTPRDAYLLLEACRVGKLHRITRRLTDLERSQIIRPGAVFVWEEKEAGIKRWTDHVRWSPSRVSGAFLVYSELLSAATRDSHTHVSDPLLKQSFSSTTLDGDRLHLIAYYSKSALDSRQLRTPTGDDNLRSIVVPTGVYPDHRATGGVEDQATRDRQRSSLLPRSSVGSFETSHSIPSSSSLESVTSSLDTPHLHPATPTQLGELSYHRPPLSGVSHLHTARSLSDTRGSSEFKYGHQPDYYSSFYPQSLAPSVTDRQTMPSDSTRWESFPPNLSTWEANTGTSAATSESVSYPSVTTTTPIASGLNSPNTSSISALGVWVCWGAVTVIATILMRASQTGSALTEIAGWKPTSGIIQYSYSKHPGGCWGGDEPAHHTARSPPAQARPPILRGLSNRLDASPTLAFKIVSSVRSKPISDILPIICPGASILSNLS